MKLKIQESPLYEKLEKITDNCLCTDYVGDVINLIINKPKPYRIFYDMKHDVYGICDAYKSIHFTIAADMWNTGWVQQFMSQNTIDEISKDTTFGAYYDYMFNIGENVNTIFVPNEDIKTKQSYKDIRYMDFVQLESGRLYMEDIYDFSSNGDLKDMYNFAKRFGYITDDRYKKSISESVEKINEIKDTNCKLAYMRNLGNGKTANYGSRYGQNIEPAGEYMNMDELWEERPEKYMLPHYEYGFIKFNKPLIIDYINSNDSGWKRTVSDMFKGLTGKRLSNAIKKAGYDGIITVSEYGPEEIVNLSGQKEIKYKT